ncbi:MAG TPA: tyrosine-type recombinase/integrase [Kofleriaceae bacterium]|nr:tyrosine-type recombinase/integrase [Kofleriaceae bacterium]
MKRKSTAVTVHREQGTLDEAAYAAILTISPVANTRRAYQTDFTRWAEFASDRGIDLRDPAELDVAAWVEAMRKEGLAPKTRARRIAALCTVYRKLKKRGVVTANPFSIEDGPEREKALALAPTPALPPDVAKRLVDTCDDSPLGKRDRAIIRVLWAVGARRASLCDMTFERVRPSVDGGRKVYIAKLLAKGGKEVQVLIKGAAATALGEWFEVLREAKLSTGPIWRTRKNAEAMTSRAVGKMLTRRAKRAKITDRVSPHTFRVSFLTYNPAGLEAKQAAAGHADPATTRLYDRASWRGKEAFEAMPEIEDAK